MKFRGKVDCTRRKVESQVCSYCAIQQPDAGNAVISATRNAEGSRTTFKTNLSYSVFGRNRQAAQWFKCVAGIRKVEREGCSRRNRIQFFFSQVFFLAFRRKKGKTPLPPIGVTTTGRPDFRSSPELFRPDPRPAKKFPMASIQFSSSISFVSHRFRMIEDSALYSEGYT